MMSVAATIQQYLQQHAVEYDVLQHAPTESLEQAAGVTGISLRQVARAVVLDDGEARYLAVLPADHVIDFAALRARLQREFAPALAAQAAATFPDCEWGCVPPLGNAYGLPVLLDEALTRTARVYFEAGNRMYLVALDGCDFERLVEPVECFRFACPAAELGAGLERAGAGYPLSGLTPAHELRRRIEQVYKLPAMPNMARRLLHLRNDPGAGAAELARVVEVDPSLSAQVVRYAGSPFFGYRGRIDSIQTAIARVLGYDMVLNMALGLATSSSFRNPPDGPLGMNAFWRHAVYGATLCQGLAKQLPAAHRPPLGMCYLAGLLQNFGFLLLGHLFLPEFFLLNKLVAANPKTPITVLERQVIGMGQAQDVLGMGHAEIGSWLMQSWEMPDEIIVALRHHHDPEFRGDHAIYAHLIQIANSLLKRCSIGDAPDDNLSPELLAAAGLESEQQAEAVLEQLLSSENGLEAIARQLAA